MPTKLSITPFNRIREITPAPGAKIDFVGVVLQCGPSKNAGRSQTRCRELTVIDDQLNYFSLTLWDYFAEVEGTKLEARLKRNDGFLVILGRNIGISACRGLSLQTRFNSTISINSTYPHALQLLKCAIANKVVLSGSTLQLLSVSSATLAVIPLAHSVISIALITAQTHVAPFYMEAEMSIANEAQTFFVLESSGCQQRKRTQHRRQFDCPKCQQRTTLVPQCAFKIALTDETGTTNAAISGNLGEELLGTGADVRFETTCIKGQVLAISQAKEMLSNRVFYIQLLKFASKGPTAAQRNLGALPSQQREGWLQMNVLAAATQMKGWHYRKYCKRIPTFVAGEMAETHAEKSASLESNREQQRLHRNMLHRARYAEISAGRKNEFLAQQQARRAEATSNGDHNTQIISTRSVK